MNFENIVVIFLACTIVLKPNDFAKIMVFLAKCTKFSKSLYKKSEKQVVKFSDCIMDMKEF